MAKEREKTLETPVLIVGAGPIGLGLAIDLGGRGVECMVIEQTDGSIAAPKAMAVNVRTMEFCRRWGVADAVRKAGMPPEFPHTVLYMTSLTGFEIARIERPSHGGNKASRFSPESAQRCNQLWFDPVLAQAVAEREGVTLTYRRRFEFYEETDGGVIAHFTDLETGEAGRIAARYLIDCSGAASPIRRGLGIAMTKFLDEANAANILFRSRALWSLTEKGPAALHYAIGPDGIWTVLAPIDMDSLWRCTVSVADDQTSFSDEEIKGYIQRMVGTDFDHEVLAVIPWVRRERVAESYRAGSVMLAGDACHQNGPEGGYGMNTGMGDVVDLGWKLNAMLAGWGGADLLASYDAERRPVALRNVAEAAKNKTDQFFAAGPAVMEASSEGQRIRAEMGEKFHDQARRRHGHEGIALGYLYADSPVCCAEESDLAGGPPADDLTIYAPTTYPGARAPHAWLGEERSILDLFGRGFTLLRLGADAPDCEGFEKAATKRGVPMTVEEVTAPEACELYEKKLVLVRPDGHVAWRGDALPTDPTAVIETVRGAGAGASRTSEAVPTAAQLRA